MEEPAEERHVDVLIVGAGLSGIGAACQLQMKLPGKSFALLESRESLGGTWDFFKYPGFRSDTDMQTLGYRFRPWLEDEAVADGPAILRYITETAREYDIERHITFNRRVVRAEWSSEDARWTVTATAGEDGEAVTYTCHFLYVCSGYYRYDQGYVPDFDGMSRFEGELIHPHNWPADLDYAGRDVIVVGSGATAVTLVPAMAGTAGHVTMLQRSPSYILPIARKDPVADGLRGLVGDRISYRVTRWKNILLAIGVYQVSRRKPGLVRSFFLRIARSSLPDGFDVDTHFNPEYEPWDQRLCMVPDGDLFESLSRGDASIVTDRIESFTEDGLRLESGEQLKADIIVTATGFDLLPFGGIKFTVDGQAINLPETVAYKGLMLSDLPNYAFTIGYPNLPFTLKADLVAGYVCRLLRLMDERCVDICVPRFDDPSVEKVSLMTIDSGYTMRTEHLLPKAGSKEPWRPDRRHLRDLVLLRHRPVSDRALRFSKKRSQSKRGLAQSLGAPGDPRPPL